MDASDRLIVKGYKFGSLKDADVAREEEKKILYIGAKLNYNDPQSVLVIYNKMINNRLFITPIGQQFLNEVEHFLLESPEVNDEEVLPIPLFTMFMQGSTGEDVLPRIRARQKKPKDFRVQYNIARLVIVLLAACILSMFMITLNAENPNILNYRSRIEDEYASWEQELSHREREVREKERELGINYDASFDE